MERQVRIDVNDIATIAQALLVCSVHELSLRRPIPSVTPSFRGEPCTSYLVYVKAFFCRVRTGMLSENHLPCNTHDNTHPLAYF